MALPHGTSMSADYYNACATALSRLCPIGRRRALANSIASPVSTTITIPAFAWKDAPTVPSSTPQNTFSRPTTPSHAVRPQYNRSRPSRHRRKPPDAAPADRSPGRSPSRFIVGHVPNPRPLQRPFLPPQRPLHNHRPNPRLRQPLPSPRPPPGRRPAFASGRRAGSPGPAAPNCPMSPGSQRHLVPPVAPHGELVPVPLRTLGIGVFLAAPIGRGHRRIVVSPPPCIQMGGISGHLPAQILVGCRQRRWRTTQDPSTWTGYWPRPLPRWAGRAARRGP